MRALLEKTLPVFQAEPGCLAYSLLADVDHPARFVTFENWQDAAALEGHMNSATMKEAKPQLEKILAQPMQQIKLHALDGSTV